MSRLLVVGGSDAGIDPSVEPLLVVADAFPNSSICGMPYHVSWSSGQARRRYDRR